MKQIIFEDPIIYAKVIETIELETKKGDPYWKINTITQYGAIAFKNIDNGSLVIIVSKAYSNREIDDLIEIIQYEKNRKIKNIKRIKFSRRNNWSKSFAI